MGLDNSIEIKRNAYTNSIPELRQFELEYDKAYEYDFEICYWRKCWNIRNDILWIIGERLSDKYEYTLDKEDIDQIIKLLESYNADNFEDSGDCIWDWDDKEYPYSEKIQQDIASLKVLRQLMDKYELEVYFYDSYQKEAVQNGKWL